MIVYIIPGKTKTIQAAVDYVCDKEKIAKDFNEFRSECEASPALNDNMSFEEFNISNVDGINRALNYIANEDKIGGFISGYLCTPETCEEEFRETKRKNLSRIGKRLEDDQGNYFYHIIQSFPESLEISDEEVHRCGVELVERLGLYQAVVASHIHPAIDEDGEVHGRCKHNHIIINSHIYHEFVDKNEPYKIKYNNCKETYAQLQLINDQIAVEHGLPIIDKPDLGKTYSWFESKENNEGKSWKARVKLDIANAMQSSEDLDSFIKSMEAIGYQMRIGNSSSHGSYISYTCPEQEHVVRDYILGKGYTKQELETFWSVRKAINEGLEDNRSTEENKVEQLLESTTEPLFIKYKLKISDRRQGELREKNINYRRNYTNYLPLTSPKIYSEAELSYIDPEKKYEIQNQQRHTITEVSGAEILDYYNRIRERQALEQQEEIKARTKTRSRNFYSDSSFYSSTSRRPYRIGLYDRNGRKRSLIELIIILAVVALEKECGKWDPKKTPEMEKQEYRRNPIYAKKDWKIQNMVDTIRIAREENVQTPEEVEEKLNQVGKDLSKSRADIRRLTAAKNRMETLLQSIEGYRGVKDICEKIQAMPDGTEKTKLQQKHAEDIDEYKRHKATMYRHKVTSEEDIQDFMERYDEILNNIRRAEEQATKFSGEYTRLRKLKYNLQLAQNKQYCYGAEYRELQQAQEK